jgi:hypothetical protein
LSTTKYFVEALSVVSLAGVKVYSPADAGVPVNFITSSPGTSAFVLS